MSTIGRAYLSQFGTKVLHNGTTHRSLTTISKLPRSIDTTIDLPNSLKHDTYGSSPAPLIPQPFTAVILLQYTDKILAEAEFKNLIALLGTRATATAVNADGTTSTCTARLRTISETTADKDILTGIVKVQMDFDPLDVWS